MLSWRSTEIDVTSPSTQLFGIVGHAGSNSNSGAFGSCCAPLGSERRRQLPAPRLQETLHISSDYFSVMLLPLWLR
jgi:hypothetical protein